MSNLKYDELNREYSYITSTSTSSQQIFKSKDLLAWQEFTYSSFPGNQYSYDNAGTYLVHGDSFIVTLRNENAL